MNGHTAAALIPPPGLAEMEQLETHVQSQLNGRVRHFRLQNGAKAVTEAVVILEDALHPPLYMKPGESFLRALISHFTNSVLNSSARLFFSTKGFKKRILSVTF